MTIEQINEQVKKTLSEKRYYHSLCVMERCEELAKHYKQDIEEAKKVGILHDIAKEMSEEEKIAYAKENKIEMNIVEQTHVGLLHAKIGADIAKKQFGYTDKMCQAIRLHTTGGQAMTMLDKILYVSDAIGKDRTWNDVKQVHQMALEDINSATLYILNLEITNKMEENKMIHPDSIFARNELLQGK